MIQLNLPWKMHGKEYSSAILQQDFFAGLTTAVMLIPQSMAYALLAGLPIEVGLYASTVPIFVYAFFGTAPSLAVGPVAMDSLLSAAAVSSVAAVYGLNNDMSIVAAALLAFMVGCIMVVMGLLRLGKVVDLLTHTIISAFTSAAALIIAINQLKLILGVELIKTPQVVEILWDAIQKLPQTHMITFGIGMGSIVLLKLLKQYYPKLPGAFIAVVVTSLLVFGFHLDAQGVKVVGTVPAGLPSFQFPTIQGNASMMDVALSLAPHALVIAMVAFMEAISVSTKLQAKEEELNPSAEFVALGLANMATGLFKGYSVTGGLSRSAVNKSAGAQSKMSGVITGIVVVITLSFFSSLLYTIPKAVLGGIIMSAVVGLISIADVRNIFTKNKREIPVYVLTFMVTLFIGIQQGLIVGVLFNWLWNKFYPASK